MSLAKLRQPTFLARLSAATHNSWVARSVQEKCVTILVSERRVGLLTRNVSDHIRAELKVVKDGLEINV